MDCEVPVIVYNSLPFPFWISIEQDARAVCATYLRLRVCRGRQSFCRGRQPIVLACPAYSTRESHVMGLYGSRDHLRFQHTLDMNWGALLELAFLVNLFVYSSRVRFGWSIAKVLLP